MARWFGPPSGNCSCCEDEATEYGAPWTDAGVAAPRFSNWDLIGVTNENSVSGTLYGVVGYDSSPFGGSYVRLYALSSRLFGSLVAEFAQPGIVLAGTINFSGVGFTGVTGTVSYDSPILVNGEEQFTVTGTPVT